MGTHCSHPPTLGTKGVATGPSVAHLVDVHLVEALEKIEFLIAEAMNSEQQILQSSSAALA